MSLAGPSAVIVTMRSLSAVPILLCLALAAGAQPVLQSATVSVTFASATACDVEMTFTSDGASEAEHRLAMAPGARVGAIAVHGATISKEPEAVGSTRAIGIRVGSTPYTLRYRLEQPELNAFRCPLWLPTFAADGARRAVHITVRLPDTATAGSTFPTFRWTGAEGTASLNHLPALVHVPYARPGESAPWDIARTMDAISIGALALATLEWARRRRRLPRSGRA